MIRSEADIANGIGQLVRLDPRLQKVVDIAGAVPLRVSETGLRGIVSTIVAQQVSKASANAIFGRFAGLVDLDDPAAILAADDAVFRAAGLSRGKQRTVLGIADAVHAGRLDFARIGAAPPQGAIAELSALHGIGVWTAECYLLFSAGHPDIFPAGDLALQVAVAHALALPSRPKERDLVGLAAQWSPHRSVAARLFWAYYHAVTERNAAPAGDEPQAVRDADKTAEALAISKKAAPPEASQRRHDRTP